MTGAGAAAAPAGPPVLAHRQEGAGPDLLLLNGGLMSIAAWEPWAVELRRDFRLLRCDLRGQLLSPGPVPPEVSGQAAEVVRLLDHLGVRRAHVAGASYGGFVAAVLAAEHPERVASLALVTTAERLDERVRAGFARARAICRGVLAGTADGGAIYDEILPETFSEDWRARNAALVAQRRAQFGRLPAAWYEGLDAMMAALERLDLEPLLPHIACPTLVVAAEADRTFPLERSRALAAAIRGARLAVVPGASHGAVVENAGEVLELLRTHLRAAGGAS